MFLESFGSGRSAASIGSPEFAPEDSPAKETLIRGVVWAHDQKERVQSCDTFQRFKVPRRTPQYIVYYAISMRVSARFQTQSPLTVVLGG